MEYPQCNRSIRPSTQEVMIYPPQVKMVQIPETCRHCFCRSRTFSYSRLCPHAMVVHNIEDRSATQFILHRTADASLRSELLADSGVLVKRPSYFLRRASDRSVLYKHKISASSSGLFSCENEWTRTGELVADRSGGVKCLGLVLTQVCVGWCLNAS